MMDNDLFQALEEKITNAGANDLYKKRIGSFTIWFMPLTYKDQAVVQDILSGAETNTNALNDAKLVSLARSIVGIDELDLRPYRNGQRVFEITDNTPGKQRSRIKVDLAKYMQSKIVDWGQDFMDLAFDIFADITQSSKKKFAENVVFDNVKDPRIELAELETRVHELRKELNLPVLVEKSGTKYQTNDGELEEVPNVDTQKVDEKSYSPPTDEESYEVEESVEEDEVLDEPLVESFSSEDSILNSVNPPIVQEPEVIPVKTVPVASPPDTGSRSPIQNAMVARRNTLRPVRQVPPDAKSSVDMPFDGIPSINKTEVIEEKMEVPRGRPPVDPPVSRQSVNPRFKGNR